VITYRDLGANGRFGNQLWQIASTIGIAVSRGDEFTFPEWKYAEEFLMPSEWFTGASGIDAPELAVELPEAARPYLQDVSYVKAAEELIRSTFRMKKDGFVESICEWLEVEECAAVHVRRGDYAEEWRGHGMLEREWYLDHWPSGKVLVFSDDPEWCKQNLPGKVAHFEEVADFHLMTRCRELLISNSSFAWWAAWISGKPTTYPDPWFTSAPVGDVQWHEWKRADR
jgi:hypothetical protein